jgi:hypothetical protein
MIKILNSFSAQRCCSGFKIFAFLGFVLVAQSVAAADEAATDEAATATPDVCWKDSYGRGVGTIPNACPAGFSATGFGTCSKDCPAGFRNDGLFCAKPAAYGRGAGYPWKFGDAAFNLDPARNRCKNENPQGCEKDGAIIYPVCKPGYTKVGCCICSPICPAGMTDIGVSCTKPTVVATCPAGKINDAGLCYNSCGNNTNGIGPVCWGKCPAGMTDCGAMCGTSLMKCGKAVFDSIVAGVSSIKKLYDMFAGDDKVKEGKADPKKLKDAVTSTPATARKIAESISKAMKEGKISNLSEIPKLGKAQYDQLVDGVGGQDNLNKLIAAAKNPSDIDGLVEVVKGLDPTGLTKFAATFKKPICGR